MVFFVICFKRIDCVSELVWSSDSLDEFKSFSLEVSLLDTCDFLSGDGVFVSFSFKDAR